ncbi:MAG: hypothetical protein AB7E49_00310 [Campylobacterales bacterium]
MKRWFRYVPALIIALSFMHDFTSVLIDPAPVLEHHVIHAEDDGAGGPGHFCISHPPAVQTPAVETPFVAIAAVRTPVAKDSDLPVGFALSVFRPPLFLL